MFRSLAFRLSYRRRVKARLARYCQRPPQPTRLAVVVARASRRGRWIGPLALGAFLAYSSTVSACPAPHPTHIDSRCMTLALDNDEPGSPSLDYIENYYGCQEVYGSDGTLIGYGRGRSYCDRRAYHYGLVKRLPAYELDRRMAGRCVLLDDWSWSPE